LTENFYIFVRYYLTDEERNFGIAAGVFTLLGALVAMLLLFAMVNTGKPQPGLPYLNAGALAGLIVFLLL